jgi:parallel beta-helix repeat protein
MIMREQNHRDRPLRSILSLPIFSALFCIFGLMACQASSFIITMSAGCGQESIQRMLDRLPAGGEVVLPPGTYEITHPIILRNDRLTLRGSGTNTVLHLADQANCPVVILGSPTESSRRTTTQLRLADLVIDGNRQHQQVEMWRTAIDGSQLNNNGIDVWNVNDSTVEKVVCRSCRSGGLVTAVVRRLDVQDFTAYDNQFDGLACYLTEDSHFGGLNLHDNLAAGISLDLSFAHNVIDNAILTGNDLGIFMRDSRNNTFQDVNIDKSRKHGVFMAQAAAATPKGWQLSPGTECTGNSFQDLTVTNSGGDAFLVNDDSCKNNIIRSSRFLANTKGGLAEPGATLVKVEALSVQ